jgi:hypothetical protein
MYEEESVNVISEHSSDSHSVFEKEIIVGKFFLTKVALKQLVGIKLYKMQLMPQSLILELKLNRRFIEKSL